MAVLTSALLQLQNCNKTGDTTLSQLELEVAGQNRIVHFTSSDCEYLALLPSGVTTATLRAQSNDSGAQLSWNANGTGNLIGLGSGEVTVDVPQGSSPISVFVRAPGGAVGNYRIVIRHAPEVSRTTNGIVLAGQQTQTFAGMTFDFEFYRNTAYGCGLSGNYTFMVVNPPNGDAADQAPLWVFLHGGGSGYFDENGDYFAVLGQTEDTWNHEETFDDLLVKQLQQRTIENGQPKDITLTRRLLEGYRLVLVSMCDHDQYSGLGTPYPNNPNPGAEVNGMQATMAAVDYTVANYPTTHVFAHGTSAGSAGVYNLAQGYAVEGVHLTGVVSDFVLSTRQLTLIEIFAGQPGVQYQPGYTYDGFAEKIGFYGQFESLAHAEARIADGFVEVPVLFVGGSEDAACMAHQPAIPEAVAEGLNNCEWQAQSLIQTIAAQADSPHQVSLLDGLGHIPTNEVTPANDIVDTFTGDILEGNPPAPFQNN